MTQVGGVVPQPSQPRQQDEHARGSTASTAWLTPTSRVVDAVRASVSIPLFYGPARLTGADGRDRWLIDGAVLSRCPIGVFDAPPGLEPRWPTFGIRLGAPYSASSAHGSPG